MDLSRIARGGTPLILDKARVVFFDTSHHFLLMKRYGLNYYHALYVPREEGSGDETIEFTSFDALVFFLWVGLQADASDHGETLTLADVTSFLTPRSLAAAGTAVMVALGNSVGSQGKEDAATASPVAAAPAAPGPAKVSTLQTRSNSPTRSSAGMRKRSGRTR